MWFSRFSRLIERFCSRFPLAALRLPQARPLLASCQRLCLSAILHSITLGDLPAEVLSLCASKMEGGPGATPAAAAASPLATIQRFFEQKDFFYWECSREDPEPRPVASPPALAVLIRFARRHPLALCYGSNRVVYGRLEQGWGEGGGGERSV